MSPISIDRLCDWGEQVQPTPLQVQAERVYTRQIQVAGAFTVHANPCHVVMLTPRDQR